MHDVNREKRGGCVGNHCVIFTVYKSTTVIDELKKKGTSDTRGKNKNLIYGK